MKRNPDYPFSKEQLANFTKARDVLKTQPGFHAAQVELIDKTDEITRTNDLPSHGLPSPERLTFALALLDARAESCVKMVSDIPTQEAFMLLAHVLTRQAWEEYRGNAPIEPIPGNREMHQIVTRMRHWVRESYKRCAAAQKPPTAQDSRLPKLPGLMPSDPRNKLSYEARQRIYDAIAEAEKIQWEAEARILTDDLDSYGLASRRLRNKSNFKAAKMVMQVVRDEYQGAGLADRELRDSMDNEIDSIVNSWDLNGAQKHILTLEFASSRVVGKPPSIPKAITPIAEPVSQPKTKRRPNRIPTTVNNLAAAVRMETFIAASPLTQTDFATQAGTSDRTLRSFRATGKIRGDIFTRIAIAMGLTREELMNSK